MELRKAIFFSLENVSLQQKHASSWAHQVCIPHSYHTPDTQLSHQQAIHPSKAELHVLDAFTFEMFGQASVNPCSKVL
jgi:hypothetical protein